MAKLLKLRRGTTSQHGSFTGAEGEVTVDTDKETLVVHDGSTAGGHPVAAEDVANVSAANLKSRLSGALTNAEVNASAAIAGTKIDPDFGSQDVETTGKYKLAGTVNKEIRTKTAATNAVEGGVTGHVLQHSLIIDSNVKDIFFTGGSSGSKYTFGSADGATHEVMRITPSVLGASQHGKVTLNYVTANAGGNTSSAKKFETTSAGVDVTGNIAVSGTVDGRDVAADGTKLDGIEASATADQTSAEIKSLLASDNITGSHIADDAINSEHYTDGSIDHAHLAANIVQASNIASNTITANEIAANAIGSSELADNAVDSNAIQGDAVNGLKIADDSINSEHYINSSIDREHLNITNSGSNGQVLTRAGSQFTWATVSGDGGNAATLDSIDSSQFLRSDTADTASGDITFSGGAGAISVSAASDLRIAGGSWTGEYNGGIKIQPDASNSYFQYHGTLYFRDGSGNNRVEISSGGEVLPHSNNTQDLGSSSKRWRNIYTGDLHLSNQFQNNPGNDVDSTWGDWTIQEGENDLFLINNRNSKKYKFNLTEVS